VHGKNNLTRKQERFITEYLADENATRAAIKAGYSKRTAHLTGARLLARPHIQKAIKVVTRKAFIGKLWDIVDADIRDFVEWGSWGIALKPSVFDRKKNAAIAYVSETGRYGGVKIRLHDKVRALDLLAKHYGLYPK